MTPGSTIWGVVAALWQSHGQTRILAVLAGLAIQAHSTRKLRLTNDY